MRSPRGGADADLEPTVPHPAVHSRTPPGARRGTTPGPRFAPSWRRRLARLGGQVEIFARSHRAEIAATAAALLIGGFAPLLLHHAGFGAPIASALQAMNLDDERVTLVSQLLVTLAGAFVAAALTRRRLAALLGALAYMTLRYTIPFLQGAQHPGLGPGGVALTLRPGALQQLALTLVGLALVAAGAGAALGGAFGSVTVVPAQTLITTGWRRLRHTPADPSASPVRAGLSLALAAIFIAALAVVGGGSGNLLMYGLTANLYRLVSPTQPQPGQATAKGAFTFVHYTSAVLGGVDRGFYIYLPPSYSVAAAERFPALYLLHGSPGSPGDWVYGGRSGEIEDALVAAGKMRETIIVSPDGNGPVVRVSEWANALSTRQQMEDAIVELVRYVDAHYRTLADAADRAIAGNSEGGYGAANIALHHPDLFSEAASFGGYFEAPTTEVSVFGAGSSAPVAAVRAYNSPSQYVSTTGGNRAAHEITFFICVGKGDRSNLYTSGVDFAAKLRRIGAKVQLISSPGAHSWSVWVDQLTTTMALMEPVASA